MEMSTSERTSPESKGGKIAWASEPNPRRARHHRHMDLLPPVDLESLSTLLHEEEPRNGTDSQSYHHLYEEGREQSCELSTTDFGSSVSQKIALYSSSLESIHYTSSFRDLGIPQRNLQSLFSETSKDSVWWLDVQNPSEKDLRLLCDTFHIHPLTFEDIWTQETREKFEDFPSYYFACFRSFHVVESESQTSFEPYTIYVIALRGGTLSFRFTESCHGTNVQERIKLLKDHVSISSAWICYALVDDIVDSFAAPISAIEKEVSEIEDQIYNTRIDDIQTFLSHHDGVRRSIVSLMNLLSGKADVLNRFKKHHKEHSSSHTDRFVDNDIHLYMDDVEDHLVTILSNLRQFESLLARSQESYFAQLSVDNAIGRSRVTSFLKKALILTSIMTFYLVICSLFSMNVGAQTPLFQRDNLTAFSIILASWVLIGIILILVAKRYRAF